MTPLMINEQKVDIQAMICEGLAAPFELLTGEEKRLMALIRSGDPANQEKAFKALKKLYPSR